MPESAAYHSTLAFHYVQNGSIEMTINNNHRLVMSPGDLIMIPPYSLVSPSPRESITGVSIFFEKPETLISSFMKSKEYDQKQTFHYLLNFYLSNRKHTHDDLKQYFNDLIGSPGKFEMEGAISTTIDIIRKEWNDYFGMLPMVNRKRVSTRLDTAWKIEAARKFIEETCMHKFNLSDVSRKSFMSKFSLIRSFKEVVGVTPRQYHIQQRVKRAKRYLSEQMSVRDVSLRCGYPDIFSFSKQFKLLEGYPPSQYCSASID